MKLSRPWKLLLPVLSLLEPEPSRIGSRHEKTRGTSKFRAAAKAARKARRKQRRR